MPCLAAPDVEVPVQIKVFIPADAGDFLRLAADIMRDLRQRRPRVEHRKLLSYTADGVECSKQFVTVEIDKVRIPVNQGGGAERLAPG
jgi:hypothetical protein